jgi:hypothetical protein
MSNRTKAKRRRNFSLKNKVVSSSYCCERFERTKCAEKGTIVRSYKHGERNAKFAAVTAGQQVSTF